MGLGCKVLGPSLFDLKLKVLWKPSILYAKGCKGRGRLKRTRGLKLWFYLSVNANYMCSSNKENNIFFPVAFLRGDLMLSNVDRMHLCKLFLTHWCHIFQANAVFWVGDRQLLLLFLAMSRWTWSVKLKTVLMLKPWMLRRAMIRCRVNWLELPDCEQPVDIHLGFHFLVLALDALTRGAQGPFVDDGPPLCHGTWVVVVPSRRRRSQHGKIVHWSSNTTRLRSRWGCCGRPCASRTFKLVLRRCSCFVHGLTLGNSSCRIWAWSRLLYWCRGGGGVKHWAMAHSWWWRGVWTRFCHRLDRVE